MSAGGREPLLRGLLGTFLIFVVVTIVTRLYARWKILKKVGTDDYFMVVAVVCQIASTAVYLRAVHFGLGAHISTLSLDQITELLKFSWIATTPGILASIFARISIAVLFYRLFGTKIWMRWYLYISTTVSSALASLVIIMVWAQCKPVQALWDFTIERDCWSPSIQQDFAYLAQSVFTLTDLTNVVIPVAIVWRLNMRMKEKLGLIIVLCLGIFTMAASILKTITAQSSADGSDPTYTSSLAVLWSSLEQSLVIVLGSIPPLRFLPWSKLASGISLASLRRINTSWRSRSNHSGSLGGQGSSSKSVSKNFGYEDLELNSSEISRDPNAWSDTQKNPTPVNGVSKATQIEVSYETTGSQQSYSNPMSFDRVAAKPSDCV